MKKIAKISAILLLFMAGSSAIITPERHDFIERCNGSTTCNLFTAWKGETPIYCPCIPYEKTSDCTGPGLPNYKVYKALSWNRPATFCRYDSLEYLDRVDQGNGVELAYTCYCSGMKYKFQCNDYTVQLTPRDL